MIKIPFRYLGFGLLFVLAFILAFAPIDQVSHLQPSMETLVSELQNRNNYIQPDQLAQWIIDGDPGFQMIDLRSDEDYQKYHITGSMHIPFEKLADTDLRSILYPRKTTILISNGNTQASQAWLLLRQMGYQNTYVLAGGVNYWVEVFTNPQPPTGAYTDDELFTYQFRKSAGPVMMGESQVAGQADREITQPEPVKRIRRTVKKKVDEGC